MTHRTGMERGRGGEAIVLLLAFALRLVLLPEATIWFDEGVSVWLGRMPLLRMAAWTAHDTHPPLYFALLHYWMSLAGDSEFSVRFLSVLVGTATVAVLYQLARTLFPNLPRVALVAALLLATSRFSVWWSQETRMYALAALLAGLNLLFTARLGRRFHYRDALGYVLVTAAGFWTLYLLALLPIIDGLYWLVRALGEPDTRRGSTFFLKRAILPILAVVSFVPWLVVMLRHLSSWSAQNNADGPLFFANLYATLLTLGISTDLSRYVVPTLVLLGITVTGLALTLLPRRKDWQRGGLVLLAATVLLPPLLVWLITVVPRAVGYTPQLEARYLLPYAAAYDLLAAVGLVGLGRLAGRWSRIATAVLVGGLVAAQGLSL
ncbi:MAG TPA: glycosyltransferase family 39 protein, partial [Chloroflexota bacterium]|nr:glycosyltransferase family 39 protein [Chloroflexota bacterium]